MELGSAIFSRPLVLVLAVISGHSFVKAQQFLEHWYRPNGSVKAIEVDEVNEVAYLGGSFDFVGSDHVRIAAIDQATGEVYPNWAKPNSTVANCIPDGSGGWFIGGSFTRVDEVPRNKLAHLGPDGTLSNWETNINGTVGQIALSGQNLIVAGYISIEEGQPFSHRIMAVSALNSNEVLWDLPCDNTIHSLTTYGDTIYVTGYFEWLDGEYRNRIAAASATTGQLLAWSPPFDPTPTIYSLAVTDSVVYMGGYFNSINGELRQNIAAVDRVNASLEPWAPNANGVVKEITVAPGTIYVAGDFQEIGGSTRNGLAALDATTGLATAWAPSLDWDHTINAILPDVDAVHIGGDFNTVNGETRYNLAALDIVTGEVLAWNPSADAEIHTLARVGSTIVATGEFQCMNAIERRKLCAIDLNTGLPTAWAPRVQQQSPNGAGLVSAIVRVDTVLFVGGEFSMLNGHPRRSFAAVSTNTGQLITDIADLHTSARIYGMTLADSLLYVCGLFNSFGGEPRGGLAAWNVETGTVSPTTINWTGFGIYDLKAQNDTVFMGGMFGNVNGEPRSNLASFIASTGELTPLAIQVSPWEIFELELNGPELYLSGGFNQVNGEERLRFASVNSVSGALTPWMANDPVFISSGRTVRVKNDLIFIGGNWSGLSDAYHGQLAVYERTSGQQLQWDLQVKKLPPGSPNSSNTVHEIAFHDSLILVGGSFQSVDGRTRQHFAAIPFCGAYYMDSDGDGFGSLDSGTLMCPPMGEGYVQNATDCDDMQFGNEIGSPCDDGDPATVEDHWSADCTCEGSLPTSVRTLGPNGLRAFPNPVADILHFSEPLSGGIFDAQGRQLIILLRTPSVAVSGLASGVYQLRTTQGSVIRFTKE